MVYDLKVLIYSVISGMIMGITYELFRILRVTFFPLKAETKRIEMQRLPSTREETAILLREGRGLSYSASEVFTIVCDVMFGILGGAIAAVLLFHTNRGEVRWFALAGCGAGFVLYILTLGRLIIGIYLKAKSLVFKIVKKILSVILAPVIIPLKRMIRAAKKRRIKRKAKRTLLNMLKEKNREDERDTSKGDNGEGEGAVYESERTPSG